MDQLTVTGNEMGVATLRDVYTMARRAGLGRGKRSSEVGPTRGDALQEALKAARGADPDITVEVPRDWLDDDATS